MDKNPNTEELLAALTIQASALTEAEAIFNGELGSDWADHFGAMFDLFEKAKEVQARIAFAEQAHAAKDSPTLQDEGVGAAVQRVTAYLDEETKYAGGVSPRHWPKGPHLSYGDLRVILAALSPHVTRYRGAQS